MLPKLALMGVLAGLLVPSATYAEDDIEYHYGFTTGTNIGDVGEREIESRLEGRIGKRVGSYGALSKKVEAEFVPWRDFRILGRDVGRISRHRRGTRPRRPK